MRACDNRRVIRRSTEPRVHQVTSSALQPFTDLTVFITRISLRFNVIFTYVCRTQLCNVSVRLSVTHWSRSTRTSQVYVQLNSTMRLISGTLRSTSLLWLPVLSNIEPPALRSKAATDKLVEKIVKHDSWAIQPDILNPPLLRLTSMQEAAVAGLTTS